MTPKAGCTSTVQFCVSPELRQYSVRKSKQPMEQSTLRGTKAPARAEPLATVSPNLADV